MTSPNEKLNLEDVLADPDELTSRYKRMRSGAAATPNGQNWTLRMHRALSWYRRSFQLAQDPELARDMIEVRVLLLWVSLMALAGRMDPEERKPAPEGDSLRQFVDEIAALDGGHLLEDFAGRHRALLRRLMTSPFLHLELWVNPFAPAFGEKIDRAGRSLDEPTRGSRLPAVLNEALYRVFVLRGQLIHGSSTAGSRLNRTVVTDSLQFLQQFVPVVLTLVLVNGLNHTWPPVCFPPVDPAEKRSLRIL